MTRVGAEPAVPIAAERSPDADKPRDPDVANAVARLDHRRMFKGGSAVPPRSCRVTPKAATASSLPECVKSGQRAITVFASATLLLGLR